MQICFIRFLYVKRVTVLKEKFEKTTFFFKKIMGFGGEIVITDKSCGKTYDYDNYKGQAVVYFNLLRDLYTGKFPILEVFFWNENLPNRRFYAYVEGRNFTCEWPIMPYGSGRACQTVQEIDINIFEHYFFGNNIISLKIFTRTFGN